MEQYICNTLPGVRSPNYRPTPDNPLLILKEHPHARGNTYRTLDQKESGALLRLVGNDPTQRAFQAIYGMNITTLGDLFRRRFSQIFMKDGKPVPITKKDGRKIVASLGTLHTCWPTVTPELTKHHMIARVRGGTDDDKNIALLPQKVHDDVHRIFHVWTPIEQLALIVLIFKQSYTPAFLHAITELLTEKNQLVHYKSGLFRNTRIEY